MTQSGRTFIATKVRRQSFRQRSGGRWAALLLVLAVGAGAGFAAARFLLQDQARTQYDHLKTRYDKAMAQARADADKLQARLDTAQGRLAIEQGVRKGLEGSLAAAQAKLGHARDQLAFFHQLFPPGPDGAINIRALAVQQQGGALTYKVLLSRNASDGSLFDGAMQFVAQGRQQGKTVKITLQPVVVASADSPASADPGRLALHFDQFQRREGELALPQGFVPSAVTLNVLQGDVVRVSRTVQVS